MIEPALGVNRSMLAFLVDAYDEEVVAERERTVLRLHPQLAPVKAAVLPLIGKSDDMTGRARKLYEELRQVISVEYDDGGQIGRRYRRHDEIGTPYALTIDEQTLEDETITIRERDSLAQERISIARAREHVLDRLAEPWASPEGGDELAPGGVDHAQPGEASGSCTSFASHRGPPYRCGQRSIARPSGSANPAFS